jgi:hypothetical protein
MVILPLLIVQEQSSGRTASYNSMSILRNQPQRRNVSDELLLLLHGTDIG